MHGSRSPNFKRNFIISHILFFQEWEIYPNVFFKLKIFRFCLLNVLLSYTKFRCCGFREQIKIKTKLTINVKDDTKPKQKDLFGVQKLASKECHVSLRTGVRHDPIRHQGPR